MDDAKFPEKFYMNTGEGKKGRCSAFFMEKKAAVREDDGIPGHERGPIPPRCGGQGLWKCITRLCRCCMPLLGNEKGAWCGTAFRRIGSASETSGKCCVVAGGRLAAGPWRPERSSRFFRLIDREPRLVPRAVESGSSSRSSWLDRSIRLAGGKFWRGKLCVCFA